MFKFEFRMSLSRMVVLLLSLKLNKFIYSGSREGGSAPQTPRPRSNIHHRVTSNMRTEMLPEAIVERLKPGSLAVGFHHLPTSSISQIEHLPSLL